MVCYAAVPCAAGEDEHTAAAALRASMYRTLLGGEEPPILRTPRGKPYYKEGNVHFSLSHSASLVLCVMSVPGAPPAAPYRVLEPTPAAPPVGGDIEAVRPPREAPRLRRIAERFFAPRIEESLAALPDGDYPRAFCEAWTRYESLVKLRGTGFGQGFAACSLAGVRFVTEEIRTDTHHYCVTAALPISIYPEE